jgi:cation diffusion facilitator family transporter
VAAYKEATRAALLGLAINFALGVTKLTAGLVAHSFALLADAVNSLGDVCTSSVILFALWYAQKPANPRHPYGHMRIEAIAGSNVAVLIMVSALGIGWQALIHFTVQHELPPVWTFWVAAGNAAIKESLYWYKIRVGKRTGSSALIANAWDHRSDALCALAVMAGLGIVRWGGPDWIWADEMAALVVVAVILTMALKLFRQGALELMDVQADDELVSRIRQEAQAVPGVRAVEKLWVRKSGLEYFADMHVEVDGQLTVSEGHRIGHLVKDRVLVAFPALRDVLVHLEPASQDVAGRPPGSTDMDSTASRGQS